MPDAPSRDEIVRLTVILEALVKEVHNLSERVEELRDEHVFDLEHKLPVVEERLATFSARLQKIEDNGRWMFRTIVGQGVALLVGLLLWWLNFNG